MRDLPSVQRFRELTKYSLVELIRDARVSYFHKQIASLVKGLLSVLDWVKSFTLDLRNWHPIMQFEDLPTRLENASAEASNPECLANSKVNARKRYKKDEAPDQGRANPREEEPISDHLPSRIEPEEVSRSRTNPENEAVRDFLDESTTKIIFLV